ncbi:ATP-utilizing chromatin assembly and remodelling N-terminal-domain-containing protein [Phyllosticta citricarpa]|uniref:ATP-utilizing chromatin assembly and remodelling N-terminal-domain-containing protein n=1 Tax=Phyllosticta citricarpa TaxID=55181 RepID=A0ABR1MFQ3_9PEZI
MVFYKRSPVQYVADPHISDENTQVWMIKQTGEVFVEYEKYAHRLDFYRKKHFTNQITGQGNLSFFDALEAEDEDAREIRTIFPKPLRYHVCRKVHHSTIPRLEELVTRIYAELKEDFYPGEYVSAKTSEDAEQRLPGIVRDKITFAPAPDNPLRAVSQPMSRYFVTVTEENGRDSDTLLDSKRLSRDRRTYSRSILRSFIRNVAYSENYKGAPWQVKPELVAEFRLPKEVPWNLTPQGIAEAKKTVKTEQPTTFYNYYSGPDNTLHKQPPQQFAFHNTIIQPQPQVPFRPPPGGTGPPPFQSQSPNANFGSPMGGVPIVPVPAPANGQFIPAPTRMAPPRPPPVQVQPRPPPIKYPIEDTEIPPRRNGKVRPQPKFLANDIPDGAQPPKEDLGIQMKSVGSMLSVWQTLNVHAEVYILDSFTLDDFIEALAYPGDAYDCQLLTEIHCALLKLLVDEQGDVLVHSENFSEWDSTLSGTDSSSSKSPSPARSETPPARRTRSKVSSKDADTTPTKLTQTRLTNRASELLSDFDWKDHLARRDFQEGKWQAIVVGILRQTPKSSFKRPICDEILAHLVPSDMEPELETVREQYNSLDINLRIAILDTLKSYTLATEPLREYMANCNSNMTVIRNQKIVQQRERKELLKKMAGLEQQRKIEQGKQPSHSPQPEANGDVSMSGITDPDANGEDEKDGTSPNHGRKLRKSNARKRKFVEDEQTRLEREKRGKEQAERAKFRMLLSEIEKTAAAIKACENEIKKYDEELRENQCQQLRPLGSDRFCNQYWWLERWGMPLGGLPTSSTAEYNYVSGRLWIQGPPELSKDLIQPPAEEEQKMKAERGFTMKERRNEEEGPIQLDNPDQWGYYDNPEDVQKLLEWLDDRGSRELKLKKELTNWQDQIVEYMVNWKTHMADMEAQKAAEGDEDKRIQTRQKATHAENDASRYWCLRWENSYAVDELGHLHSEEPPKKNNKKTKGKKR